MRKLIFVSLLFAAVSLSAQGRDGYAVSTVFSQGPIRVSIFTGPEDKNFLLTQYLVIENGAAAQIDTWDNVSDSNTIADVAVKKISFQDRGFLVVVVHEHNRSMYAMDAFVEVYQLGTDQLAAAGSDHDLPRGELAVSTAGDNTDGKSRIKLTPTKVSADDEQSEQRTVYLAYDDARKAFQRETLDSGFTRKTVAEPAKDAETPGETTNVDYCQLNDDHVNLRAEPGTNQAVIRALPRSALFTVIDRTDSLQTIAGKTDRWYRVLVRGDQAPGWIFGSFILRDTH